jgi:hypothetical protein
VNERDINPAARASLRIYQPAPLERDEHTESSFTRLIEQQTARIPSHYFLVAALGSLAASLTLELMGSTRLSRFIGMWAPTLLITGVYNKLVKSLGPR